MAYVITPLLLAHAEPTHGFLVGIVKAREFGDAFMSFDTQAPEYKEADRRAANQAATQQQPTVPTTRARQGVTGHNVRYVLGFGVAAVVVAFVIVYVIFFG
jgi:hypothetical protein